MLDFLLVLGQVPGTNFQITFYELVAIYALLPFLWLARKKLLHIDPCRTTRNLFVYLHSKKGQQLKLPL